MLSWELSPNWHGSLTRKANKLWSVSARLRLSTSYCCEVPILTTRPFSASLATCHQCASRNGPICTGQRRRETRCEPRPGPGGITIKIAGLGLSIRRADNFAPALVTHIEQVYCRNCLPVLRPHSPILQSGTRGWLSEPHPSHLSIDYPSKALPVSLLCSSKKT